jgi:DNA-binding PadR family transcriptional regulator
MSGGNADLKTADIALPKIPATAWAVLGILSFGRELTGYDIKNWSDAILHFFYWSPATSQIYTELRRLEDLGLVRSRTVARDEVRDKTLYAITPIGT